MLSFFSAKGVEGLQRGGQCAILKSEIRAALRAATLAKAFRTHRRRKKVGKHIRAAKCHFDTDSTRLPVARISKPHPRKGTETAPCGASAQETLISKPHPRKGTETVNFFMVYTSFLLISKPYPRKGTETTTTARAMPPVAFYFKTISPQGDENTLLAWSPSKSQPFQNHIPARGRKQVPDILIQCRVGISKPYPRKGTETATTSPATS